MFGYVVINRPELKVRHYDEYHSWYCGLCRELKERFGIRGQISLTYDMTFVILLLDGLYEPPVKKGVTCCAVHPLIRQTVRKSAATEYGADMNLLLSYYKCMDDWKDEKKLSRLLYAKLIEGKNRKLSAGYEKKAERILSLLKELTELEKAGETDIDRMSGCFGRLMEEVLCWKEDQWEKRLRRLGFYLGKYIYLLDAYDDLEEDLKKGSYNPFTDACKSEGFDTYVQGLLTMMITETCREFEKLPILKHEEILRNILYSGVWCRFAQVKKKRGEKAENFDSDLPR